MKQMLLPELNHEELAVLQKNPLFTGLDREELGRMLSAMQAEKTRCERGELLQPAGKPVRRFGLVLSGAVQVFVDDIEGNRMIMAEVAPGHSFGPWTFDLETGEGVHVCLVCGAEERVNVREEGLPRLFSCRGRPSARR